jgi:hypothetical protein
MTAVEKHRGLAVGCCELQPACGCPVCAPHFGDDARNRAVTQRILGHREDLDILATLAVEDLFRAETDLLEARRVEIELCHRPQDIAHGSFSETGCDARKEKRCGSVVGQACRGCSKLMQTGCVQAAIGEPIVELGQFET